MFSVTSGNKTYRIELEGNRAVIDGEPVELDLVPAGRNTWHLLLRNRSYLLEIVGRDTAAGTVTVKVNNKEMTLEVKTELDELLKKMGLDNQAAAVSRDVEAPMPGLILDINVQEGQEVQKGDKLLVLEAMKMENVIKAPGSGKVKTITVKKGESVELGQKLILFE